ncbi:hypothetical protein [Zooshikella ganghwensis]|uniref:CdiI immunity protein domain-containing protein n=1 Tax=Zooshikella ganghwensis TaxID=202772 RepID=A0A4V1IN37_9GAMM|nr:hypothetical protein [Zooshikella ganghwensis]RDH42371.1 hypothetical protein B9G39_02340 [Zooshikella ganghwensis]
MALEDPLKRVFSVYCNVNSLGMVNIIAENLKAYDQEKLKEQLIDAIENDSISVEEYESVTDDEYETQEELATWFKELWQIMFGTPYKER